MRHEKSEGDLVALIEGSKSTAPPERDTSSPLDKRGRPLWGPGGIYESEKDANEWAAYAESFMHSS